MCLGIPGQLVDIDEEGAVRMGTVDFDGVLANVCLEYVKDAIPGDYVLVHVGFALARIDESQATQVFEDLKGLPSEERASSGENTV